MIFLEAWARPLALLHLVAGAVVVGSSTHQLLWCRLYLKGRYQRLVWERRFAAITALAFVVTFVAGGLLYPTYRVRTRAEYFDSPSALAAQRELVRAHSATPAATTRAIGLDAAPDLAWVGHLFDVKEHWVALGAAAALLLALLAYTAHPKDHPETRLVYVGLSLAVFLTSWIGGIIGIVTASYHAVGGGP